MKYVALLRGINVGGKNKLNMKELVHSFSKAGLRQVQSYINSGNILFEDSTHTRESLTSLLEETIATDFGLSVPLLLRTYSEIETLMKQLPEEWANDKEQKSDVLFLWRGVDSLAVIDQLQPKDFETVLSVPGALLWHIERAKQAKSALVRLPSKALYKSVTIRNVNSVRAIWNLLRGM